MSAKRPRVGSGGENPEFILRDFGGMNVLASRDGIDPEEFYWLENVIPVSSGAMYPVQSYSASLATLSAETGAPSYILDFNLEGTEYLFAVWQNSGNGYVIPLTTFVPVQIITGMTSGQTSAAQWGNQGLLIVDPTGFWDWNLTAPNTLTPQNNSVASMTVAVISPFQGVLSNGTYMRQSITTSTGVGLSFQGFYTVSSARVVTGGINYEVGDTILLTDNNPVTPATITVTAVSGGVVTGIALPSGGNYPGPTSSTPVLCGPSGVVSTTTGLGSGVVFTVNIQYSSVTISDHGYGYASTDTALDEYQNLNSIFVTAAAYAINTSGIASGTSITTYAGRAWIASGRVVSFTDIDSYFSFGGAGGSFTINDQYLHININCLFTANNYLYIFGDDSIDALSNVSIVNGLTTFSRVNITAAVGTNSPTSVFSYYRAVAFQHSSGLYLLSGATPEKFSEKINGIIQNSPEGTPVFGGVVLVQNELCAVFQMTFYDVFTSNGLSRTLFLLFFRGKWWVASMEGLVVGAMVSAIASGRQVLYFWTGNQLYQAFDPAAALSDWTVKTCLWDASSPLREKQAINAASAFELVGGQSTTGVTLYVDTEYGTTPGVSEVFQTLQWVNQSGQPVNWVNQPGQAVLWSLAPSGYYLFSRAVESGSSQYIGLTLTGTGGNVSQIRLLGLRGKQDRNMLE